MEVVRRSRPEVPAPVCCPIAESMARRRGTSALGSSGAPALRQLGGWQAAARLRPNRGAPRFPCHAPMVWRTAPQTLAGHRDDARGGDGRAPHGRACARRARGRSRRARGHRRARSGVYAAMPRSPLDFSVTIPRILVGPSEAIEDEPYHDCGCDLSPFALPCAHREEHYGQRDRSS